MKKSIVQHIYDFFLAPLRMGLLTDSTAEKLGLSSLEKERIYSVLPFVKGKLLDVGCGNNRLSKTYGDGVGVDVYQWPGGAILLTSSDTLPFVDGSFDTVTMLASLNHIPNRAKMLLEARRVLKDDGQVIITMINPAIGFLVHKLVWHSEDKVRGMAEGEIDGIWNADITRMFRNAGFRQISHSRFLYGLNNIHIFKKAK